MDMRLIGDDKSEGSYKLEFKIEGMTCVACSGSVERLMHNEFSKKGMLDVSIALLTHKMMVSFQEKIIIDKTVTPEMICDEVECIGFGCELLEIIEIQA
jgi:cation transport ATPase